MCYIIVVIYDMNVLIYHIHWIICFLNIHNKIIYFSSIMLLKWDVT